MDSYGNDHFCGGTGRCINFKSHCIIIEILFMENNSASQNFAQTGLILPPAPTSMGVYKPFLIDGNHLHVSGHGPLQQDRTFITRRIGDFMNMEEGKQAAQQVGLTILATVVASLSSLDKVKRVIKVLGMVSRTPDFENHPYVINGCSELFKKIWEDENGVGVRSAAGMGSLPGNIPVEIEALFELY